MIGRIVRSLVSIAFIGLCGLTVLRAADIVRFGIAEEGLSATENRFERLRPWLDVPGLAYEARLAALPSVSDWKDKAAVVTRRDQESAVLAVRPLAADFWLLLADMRQIAGDSPSKVVQALTMSTLVGRNEGYLMPRRGMFAVSSWEILPGEARQRGAQDLVASDLSNDAIDALRTLLSTKSEDIRADIAMHLKAAGLTNRELAEIGLSLGRGAPADLQ